MLKLDEEFKDSFFKYYGNMSPHEAIKIAGGNDMCDGFSLVNCINVVKTAASIGFSYLEYFMKASQESSFKSPDVERMEKFIFDIAFSYLFNVAPDKLGSFLGIRFKARDIYKEIAEQAYGSGTPENIEKIKAIKTDDTYSIQKPNPVSRDRWFYDLSVTVGSYSKCHSRKIGAVLVKDNSVISTGYNGPPRGVPTCDQRWVIDKAFKEKYGKHMLDTEHDDIKYKTVKGVCPRRVIGFPSGEGLGVCPAGHAERNALINAARLGIKTDNAKLYMSCGVPCSPCMVEIINSGVEEIVCSSMHIYDETAMYLLENSDLKIRIFDFLV